MIGNYLQSIGLFASFVIVVLKLVITIVDKYHAKAGRITSLWLTIYLLFIFIITFTRRSGLMGLPAGQVLFSVASIITLLGMVSHLFLKKEIDNGTVDIKQVEKIKLEGELIKK